MADRFSGEALINILTGRHPRQGEILTRGRDRWQYENILGPTVEHGNVSTDLTIDLADGVVHVATLAGNVTVAKPKNLKAGRTFILVLIQDGTGSRTVSWDAIFKWPAGEAPELSTDPGSIDIVTCVSLEISETLGLYSVAQMNFA